MTPSAEEEEEEIPRTMKDKIRDSYEQLLASLNAMRVLVAHGGNAAAMAKRLARELEARSKRLKPKVNVMERVGGGGGVGQAQSCRSKGEFSWEREGDVESLDEAASLAGNHVLRVFALAVAFLAVEDDDAHSLGTLMRA
ncbi:hypothetical protein HDU96_011150 [Phlyctochytrium bullatum]|nr:hypothetical protein HDU96_011150 [Phlyctochytrium bullatum]